MNGVALTRNPLYYFVFKFGIDTAIIFTKPAIYRKTETANKCLCSNYYSVIIAICRCIAVAFLFVALLRGRHFYEHDRHKRAAVIDMFVCKIEMDW